MISAYKVPIGRFDGLWYNTSMYYDKDPVLEKVM
jgi:hypothetical protein